MFELFFFFVFYLAKQEICRRKKKKTNFDIMVKYLKDAGWKIKDKMQIQ